MTSINNGAPPQLNAELIFEYFAGINLPCAFLCSGIKAKESRGNEIIAALSRAFEMCTNNMVSERLPAAVLTDPTRSSASSALLRPSRVSEPTIK